GVAAAVAGGTLRGGARAGGRGQDGARRRVRPVDGALAADPPGGVCLRGGTGKESGRVRARQAGASTRAAALLDPGRLPRGPGQGGAGDRARAARAADLAGGGQHGEHPVAAVYGEGPAGGAVRGGGCGAENAARAVRAT